MIKKFLLLASITVLVSNCSFFTNKVEALVTSENELSKKKSDIQLKASKKSLFCFEKKINLLLEDEATIKYYQPLFPILFDTKNFSFIQKAAMLSLIEMTRRPDEASPTSRLQYYLRFNSKNYYFDFSTINPDDDSKMPLLKGIENLLISFDNSKNLNRLIEILDGILPQNMNVSPELETFLKENRNELIKNESLAEAFFKGDEVLTRHESFKKTSLKKLVSRYYSEKKSSDQFYNFSKNSLFKNDTSQVGAELNCNVDINQDNALNEELFNFEKRKSHYFAIKDNDNFFIAVSSAIIQKPFKNIEHTYFFKAKPVSTPLPVCQFKNNQQDIALISTSGRNPSQHLKHLLTYDIEQIDSFKTLAELLNFSRHLFLSNPDRILYESKRGRKSQLDFFLSMNFPIYHVDSLGDIIGSAAFRNGPNEDRSLVVDDRSQARIWCVP
ncbi:MAG: hypothetical protein WC635_17965 [Bacteriovorax sp.]|jgi:hypothetical protein